jgi:hypothetical protein
MDAVNRVERTHMCRTAAILRFVVVSAIVVVGTANCQAQEPARKVLYSLEPGETIMEGESLIALSAEADDVVLVTTKGKGASGPFFVFRRGSRKGPFANLKDAMTAAYDNRSDAPRKSRDCASYQPPAAPAGAQVSTVEGKGGQTVQFKGKSIGPHSIVFAVRVTPDGALAYVTSSDKDKAWFESSNGLRVSFGGIPTEFKFSPDGQNAAVLVEGSLSMNEMEQLAKLPPDRMAAAFQAQAQKYLYTIDGKKYGPFGSSFSGQSFWFAKSSNDLYVRAGDQVFRNGAPMLSVDSLNDCNFYPSADGKAYAMFDYASIRFSDGKQYPSPLDVVTRQDKGKTVFRWIALENKKDLVVYERSF